MCSVLGSKQVGKRHGRSDRCSNNHSRVIGLRGQFGRRQRGIGRHRSQCCRLDRGHAGVFETIHMGIATCFVQCVGRLTESLRRPVLHRCGSRLLRLDVAELTMPLIVRRRIRGLRRLGCDQRTVQRCDDRAGGMRLVDDDTDCCRGSDSLGSIGLAKRIGRRSGVFPEIGAGLRAI